MRGRKARLKLSRYLNGDLRNAILESRSPRELPQIVWTYWQQGERTAPDLVQRCIDSWRTLNPGWDVRVLDQETVPRYISMHGVPQSIRVQHYSDILRIRLLDEHGGVWVDATTLCARPLDHWLPPLMQSGFFAFSRPGPDRELASWFLASERGGRIVRAWRKATDAYWLSVDRADNYYWLHYLFAWVTINNRSVGQLWANTPHISADAPLLIQRCLRQGYNQPHMPEGTSLEAIPVHKLNWRKNTSMDDVQRMLPQGVVLHR
jgi:hypothetical protein